jgi:hypothetical protein
MFRFQTQTARDASGAGIRGGPKANSYALPCVQQKRGQAWRCS